MASVKRRLRGKQAAPFTAPEPEPSVKRRLRGKQAAPFTEPKPVPTDRLVSAIKVVLDGVDMQKCSVKKLRGLVAEHLQLGIDGLERQKDEFNNLVRPILDDIFAKCPAEQGGTPEWLTDVDENAKLTVFLITFAAVLNSSAEAAQTPLRTLDGLRREDIRDAVLDAFANPSTSTLGGRPRKEATPKKLVVFLEVPWHFHVAVSLADATTFIPFKQALRQRSKLASHWSTSHREWCTALRYGTHASDKKTVDEEPLVWTCDGREAYATAGYARSRENSSHYLKLTLSR